MVDFWDLVDVRDLDECWPWLGSTRGANYGQCSFKHHRSRIASRAAYERWYGVPLGDLLACHSCDNTLCCNPLHLFAGTHEDNTQDAIVKGRFVLPRRHKNTKAARQQLAANYADKEWRTAQGRRIAAGHAARKARTQSVVRQFAFGGPA